MLDFFSYLFLLLVPVLLILIVRLKRRRRVVYSHTFLRSFEQQKLLDYLLRTFQIYHDVLFDLILALVLAAFLSQLVRFSPNRSAVCIDGSYSMLQGQGQTGLEKALTLAAGGELSGERQRLYLLGWDGDRGRTGVFRLRMPAMPPGTDFATRSATIRSFVAELRESHTFFNVDPSALGTLYRRGFRRVIFITDRYAGGDTGLEIIEVGAGERSFFYPTSASYDFSSERFRILLYRFNFDKPIAVLRYDQQLGDYRAIPSAEQPIPGSDLTQIELEAEGLYRILGPGLDFIFALEVPRRTVELAGTYSRILAEVLPQLEEGASRILLADLPYGNQPERKLAGEMRRLGRYERRYITLIPESDTPAAALIYPLERSFSQPCYAELPRQLSALSSLIDDSTGLFFQDPMRTRDGQTPLIYLSYLESGQPIDFSHKGDLDSRGWKLSRPRSGTTSFTYVRKNELRPVNLDAREFFPVPPRKNLEFQRREVDPLPYFFILLVVYLIKIAVLIRFQRSR
jgi:hypothetical protein